MRLFAERGVAATSIRDIAAAVGVQPGSIYVHFESKEVLVGRLFWDGFEAYGSMLASVAGHHDGHAEKLAAMVRELCRLGDEDWSRFSFLLLAQHGALGEDVPIATNPIDVVRQVVAAARPDRDPDLLTSMVVGVVLQAATFRIYGRITRSLTEMSDEIAAACRRIVFG